MFVITEKAATQFLNAKQEIPEEGIALRLFARRQENGMAYNMGFDTPKEEDISYNIAGVPVVVDQETDKNVAGMMIDFGEHEGAEQFIFANPQDKDPETCGSTKGDDACGTGGCSCG